MSVVAGTPAGLVIFLKVCSAAAAAPAAAGGAGFAMRGHDVEAEIPLRLEEVHRGVKRTITLQVTEPCP
jgi:DnaJ-class molecular chaperone